MAFIMTVTFISTAGTCVTSVRQVSQAHCGYFVCTCCWIIYLLLREKKGQREIVDLSLLPKN